MKKQPNAQLRPRRKQIVNFDREMPELEGHCKMCGQGYDTYTAHPLYAAAPELLQALEDMVASFDRGYDLPWGTARAAIKKAKGE